MGRKKKDTVELRFYDIPQNEPVLALMGEEWVRDYGREKVHLHFHNMMEIGLSRRGRGLMEFGETALPYESEMITVIPRNYPHTTTSEEGEKSFWEYLFFDPEIVLRQMYPNNEYYQKKILKLVNQKCIFGRMDYYPQLSGVTNIIVEEMRQKNDFYRDTVKSLIQALILEIARLNKGEEVDVELREHPGIAQISPALDYIGDNYSDAIRIELLASLCNMSETHFRRLFEEYINMTPVDYINMIRVQMACEIMKKTSCTMDEVAMKSGFAAACTFNRNFKKIVGITPYQWKKNPDNYESKLMQFHISALKGW
jgi:AraC-like DNA-binding protein